MHEVGKETEKIHSLELENEDECSSSFDTSADRFFKAVAFDFVIFLVDLETSLEDGPTTRLA